MTQEFSDRNLLISIIALQMNYVNQDQMVDAMKHWTFEKSIPIEEVFKNKGYITETHVQLLQDLSERHVELHAGDIQESIVSFSDFSALESILGDVNKEAATLEFYPGDQTRAEGVNASQAVNDYIDALNGEKPKSATDNSTFRSSQRFELLRPFATGGLGQVLVAKDRELNREVAVKQIQPQYDEDQSRRARFLLEAEVTGRLEHPCIVPVYSLGFNRHGKPFYAMKLIRGDSLKVAISRLHNPENEEASSVAEGANKDFAFQMRQLVSRFLDVCQAIDYAHSRGVLHRDLKPSNIMLGKYGETLVVDWGLAKTLMPQSVDQSMSEDSIQPTVGEDIGAGSTETRIGAIVGTLAYMSPEQASGNLDQLSYKSDIYGLGATLFSIVSGSEPIEHSSSQQMVEAVLTGRTVEVERTIQKRFPALVAICNKAMALDPESRYRSAGALAQDLERWLADEPISAFKEPVLRKASRWVRRHQTFVATACSVVGITLLGLIAFSSILSNKNAELQAEQVALKDSRHRIRNFAYSVLRATDRKVPTIGEGNKFRQAVFSDCYEEFKALAGTEDDPVFQIAFADAAVSMGSDSTRGGEVEAGLGYYQQAIEVLQELATQPDEQENEVALAAKRKAIVKLVRSYGHTINALKLSNRYADALETSQAAIAWIPKITEDDAASSFDKAYLVAKTQLDQAELQLDMLDHAQVAEMTGKAIEDFDRAQEAYVETYRRNDPNAEVYRLVAIAYHARALSNLGDFETADSKLESGIAEIRELLSSKGTTPNRRYMLAALINERTDNEHKLERLTPESIDNQLESIEIIQQRHDERPTPGLAERVASGYLTLSRCHLALGDVAEAKTAIETGLEFMRPDIDIENSAAEHLRTFAECLEQKALIQAQENDASSKATAQEALEAATAAAQMTNGTPSYAELVVRLRQLTNKN